MSCKLVTYHTSISTGIGGIENLYRSFFDISLESGYEHVELFHRISGTQIAERENNKKYIQLLEVKTFFSKFNSLFLKMTLAFKLFTMRMGSKDIFVVNNPSNLIFIPSFILKRTNVVLIQANNIDTVYSTFFSKLSIKLKGKFVDIFTVYTPQDMNKLLKRVSIPDYKVKIIPRACKIKTALFPRDESNGKKLITVCRIEEKQKNIATMVKIVNSLPQGYTLDIYGEGCHKEIEKLKELISDCPRIRYLGPSHDVELTLKNYSVFLMTSHYEGFGQTLIEARSQGVPVVVFNTFEAAEYIVKSGINGGLIEPFNIDKYCDCIVEICENDSLYRRYSEASLELAKQTDSSVVFRLWVELFKSFDSNEVSNY
ncbi:TPA: glycosyltransferase [Vibrio alginolyticus]|uniref:glycosyltransferase n=1 Tax=Vibrio TaxID=662 RepID=UPI0000D552F7|nr:MULTISPECIES: glycosyltransferase [Vibrio]EAS75366.1 UDP-glucose:polyglycerol phosphate glucosyltransferase [Vibrio alginolyticus 12G01]MCS0108749.1 glycosyltransferase [Vibrio alginolyticus]MDW1463609.1 glycosyltransferase [Vibrio sp. YT-16]NNN66169.1 glycosyltransferase family 4 protein [Vibrio sp. 2-1(7)]NOH87964.1 glycosyltransferase family 4 protein [Vibrio alginolyticus]